MKVVVKLDISKEKFYKFLLENLKKEFDIKGKVEVGTKFEKVLSTRFNQGIKTNGEVVKLIEYKDYVVQYKSYTGTNTIEYIIKEIESDKIEVTYVEKYKGNSWLQSYNHFLIELTFIYFFKRRKKAMFKMVEEYLKNRK